MPSLKNPKIWSVYWWQILIVVVIGVLGYSIGMNRARSKNSLKEPLAEAKQLIRDQRHDQDQLKAAAKAEGAKLRRLRSSQAELLGGLEVEDLDPLPVALSFSHHVITGRNWVNVAARGDEGFFCCDYSDVHYLDTKDGQLHKLPKPTIDGIWCPTGLAWVKDEDILLVANYEGHNVFEFRYVGGQLELQWTYRCEGMKSPEGMAVSRDGKLIGVADYDGSRLWVFNRRGSLAWQKEIGLAHGVAFGADSVYVTSLLNKNVEQFSLKGEEVRRIGQFGWGSAEFIWPTSVFADEHGLIVSDAHTGRISLFNYDLSFVNSFGGNGPDTGLFNMPYCTIRHQNKYWICDTFKQRILDFSPSAGIESQFSASPPVAGASSIHSPAKARWNYMDLHSRIQGKEPQFLDGAIYSDYGRLMQLDDESGEWRPLNLQVPYTSLWSPGMFTYFTWIRPVERHGLSLMAIGSVSHSVIFMVHPDGRCTLENTGGRSPLQAGTDGVYELDGAKFDFDLAADSALRKFSRHESLLDGSSHMRREEAARAAFWPEIAPAEFTKKLAAEFQSEAGKKFWSSYSSATLPAAEETAAVEFDSAMKHFPGTINLTELWMRRILVTGSRPQR